MRQSINFKKGISILILFVVAISFVCWVALAGAGNIAGGAFNHWPDTGQTKCYDNLKEIPCPGPEYWFYGQDAQYQGPQRSYTKLGYGGVELPDSATQAEGWIMTRDNVTGLIWEIKTNDGSIHDKNDTYSWCDHSPDTNGGEEGRCTDGTDTEDFIAALNNEQFGGFSDWRLPTIKELSTIRGISAPLNAPFIDSNYFPNMMAFYYWSSTAGARHSYGAWCVYFGAGTLNFSSKSAMSHVIAVRSEESPSNNSFVDNHDGTVTDLKTGLMWQKCTMGQSYNPDTNGCDGVASVHTWKSALDACESLELAGFHDWRLPNRNELQSIVDYSLGEPSIDLTYFPGTQREYYWSATTMESYPSYAWGVDFDYGYVPGKDKSKIIYLYARAVRSSQSEVLGDADHDGDVDGKDLSGLASALSTGNYDPVFDLNHDEQLNELDVEIFAGNFGKS